jgi:dienelactone hydrolase
MRSVSMRVLRLVVLLGLLAVPAAAQEIPAVLIRLPEPAALGRLVRPVAPGGTPIVIVLPDALGDDGRSEVYVDSLLARGIATLVLGVGEDIETPAAAVEPAADPGAVAPAVAWAALGGIAPAQIGVMGFGLGGRAALAAAPAHAVAALYPRCPGLHAPAGPALIVQGALAAEGCDALGLPEGVSLIRLPGARHGWDVPGAIWPSPGPMVPDPAGGPRQRAVADLDVTLRAAELVADWFEEMLVGHALRASR